MVHGILSPGEGRVKTQANRSKGRGWPKTKQCDVHTQRVSLLTWAPGVESRGLIGDKQASPGKASASAAAEPRETTGELASEEGLAMNQETLQAAAHGASDAGAAASTPRPVRGAWLIRAAAVVYLITAAVVAYAVLSAV